MRHPLGAIAVAGALAIASVPSAAAAAPTEVDGNRLAASGLVRVVQGCVDADAEPSIPPTFLITRGPGTAPLGDYSSGWQVTGSQFAAGSAARMASPTTLSRLRIAVNSPGGETEGIAVATYFPPADDGYWVGSVPLAATTQGWRTVDAANRFFSWNHYSPTGTLDGSAVADTIAGHAATHGGDGEGAELGFAFGCNGARFFVDRLEITSDDDALVFDYGGLRTRAELRMGSRTPDRTTITVGETVDLTGRLFEKYTDDQLSGTLRLQRKPLDGGRWTTFRRDTVNRRTAAAFPVKPTSNTAYRILYPGTATRFEGDVTQAVAVTVRMRATASFADPTITRGTRYAAVGRVYPGKRAAVKLQRSVDGQWRTVRQGTTTTSGGFRLEGTAQETGTSYWRVRVDGGETNADAVSPTFKLTVTAPPPDDPPPPPDDDPPPPEGSAPELPAGVSSTRGTVR